MRHPRQTICAFLLALLLIIPGCTGGWPTWLGGSGGTVSNEPLDPVVVVEKGTETAVNAIDAFLQLDNDSRVYMRTELPAIHAVAERLRREAPRTIRQVRALTRAYKEAPSQPGSDALDQAYATLESLARLARKGLQDYGVAKNSATQPS